MNKKKTILAAFVLLLVVAVGGAIAYFTDTDEQTNTFTIGNVDISLTEPNWNKTDSDSNGVPDASENLMPGQSVFKDPTINNLSTKNAAYVFAKVVVPCTSETTPKEIFTYDINLATYDSVDIQSKQNSIDGNFIEDYNTGKNRPIPKYHFNDDAWTELTSAAVACTNGNATHVYYYGTNGALTELAKATSSTAPTPTSKAVFDKVTVLSTLKGNEGLTGNKDIVVTGYGIQKDGLASNAPATVWGYLTA